MENMQQTMIEIVAQTSAPANANGTGGPGGAGKSTGGAGQFLFPVMFAMVVFYIFLFRGQGRKKKELAKMIQGLKKNDRVQTIGGILGTVVSAKDNEIVVRVDETNNTKMTFMRQSIQRVITGDTEET